ncbi:unnamed protein product [Dovyalis caffra]|uniref:Uncharacterized protein n=1 Tax=Dovyalis caffra TaxID=77055 RepID=A0AAV1QUE4_9ROSI|nr:unnamed protein product [Dovyalis caffra]CAK7324679.1 unnamed protein product [Dovyalis caffra]
MERSLGVRKGAWTEEEDILLRKCVEKYGEGRWRQVPLRGDEAEAWWWLQSKLQRLSSLELRMAMDQGIDIGPLLQWALIAGRLPGRTAIDVKNYWNTRLRKKMVSSNKDVKSKPEPKSITKATIVKPRPRNFKNISWLREGTPFINVCHPFGDDLCKPYSTMASPPSDNNEVESLWWESLLDDKDINLTSNSSFFGNGSEIDQEPIKSVFVEENVKGGGKVRDIFYEQGQRSWCDFSFDAGLLNLIDTEL